MTFINKYRQTTSPLVLAFFLCLLCGTGYAAESPETETFYATGKVSSIATTQTHIVYQIAEQKYYLNKKHVAVAGEIDNIKRGNAVTLSYKVENEENNILQIYNIKSDLPPSLRFKVNR